MQGTNVKILVVVYRRFGTAFGPIFDSKVCLSLEHETDRMSQNVGNNCQQKHSNKPEEEV